MSEIMKNTGLSLCIQGTPKLVQYSVLHNRFIPVYTGNTNFTFISSVFGAVYPCVYREHDFINRLTSGHFGLSLCIQGTQFKRGWFWRRVRFIPVYTGNTIFCSKTNVLSTVYPCVYREHLGIKKPTFFVGGLSLCIQGTRLLSEAEAKKYRFIPVYTGNTWWYVYQNVISSGLSLCIQGTL